MEGVLPNKPPALDCPNREGVEVGLDPKRPPPAGLKEEAVPNRFDDWNAGVLLCINKTRSHCPPNQATNPHGQQ